MAKEYGSQRTMSGANGLKANSSERWEVDEGMVHALIGARSADLYTNLAHLGSRRPV
jgi:hypothetical protein